MVDTIFECERHSGQAPAIAARLRRVPGINGDHRNSGACCLLSENADKLCPSRIVSRLRQPRAGDALDVQRFVGDHAVPSHEIERGLVLPVAPLIADVLVQSSNPCPSLAALVAPFLAARQMPLHPSQFRLRLPVKLRRRDLLAVRRGKEGFQAKINPDSGVCGRGSSTSGNSQEKTTNQCPALSVNETVLIAPSIGRCILTFTAPMCWK